RLRPTAQQVARARSRPRCDDVGHRNIDSLPLSGLDPLRPRRADAERGDSPRREVGDRDARDCRFLAGAWRERARESLVVHVVSGARDVGPGLAVARYRAIDDRRVLRPKILVAQSETRGDAGPPPL